MASDDDSDFGNNVFSSYRKKDNDKKRKSKNERKTPPKKIKLTSANLENHQINAAKNVHKKSANTSSSHAITKRKKSKVDVISDIKITSDENDLDYNSKISTKFNHGSRIKEEAASSSASSEDILRHVNFKKAGSHIDSDVETVRLNSMIHRSESDISGDETEYAEQMRSASDDYSSDNNVSNKSVEKSLLSREDVNTTRSSSKGKRKATREPDKTLVEDHTQRNSPSKTSKKKSRLSTTAVRDDSGNESEIANLPSSTSVHTRHINNSSSAQQGRTVQQKDKRKVPQTYSFANRRDVSSSESDFEPSIRRRRCSRNSESFGGLTSEFISNNPDYKEVTFPKEVSLSQLDNDTEFFYLQLPDKFNVRWLKDTKISLSGKTKIQAADKTFVIKPEIYQKSMSILSDCLKSIQPSKALIMEEVSKIRKGNHLSSVMNAGIEVRLPIKAKIRHSTLGALFSQEIQPDHAVQTKLKKKIRRFKKVENKLLDAENKKNVNTSANEASIENENEMIFEILQSDKFESTNIPNSSKLSKKQKQKKKSSGLCSVPLEEKHPEKSKDSEDTDSGIVDIKSEPLLPEVKGRKYSFINSTLNPSTIQPKFNPEISQISTHDSPKQVKSKQKTKQQFMADILSSVKSKLALDCVEQKQKRRKKSHS